MYIYGKSRCKKRLGHAKDYVAMQWLMLQQDQPDDYVIATGRMESVREFIEIAAQKLGWRKDKNNPGILWEGKGLEEVGRRQDTNEIVIRIDPRYFRPAEVEQLQGDPSKAFHKLGWEPSINLEQMVEEMIKSDREDALRDSMLISKGFEVFNTLE